MKNVIIVVLCLIAIASAYWFWIKPAPETKYSFAVLRKVPMADDPPAGDEVSGYVMVKKEIKDWLDIFGKAVSPVSLLLAFWVKRKKK